MLTQRSLPHTFRRKAFVLLLLILGIVAATHFWITDRNGVLRFFYPVQALLVQPSLDCTPQAPSWLRQALKQALWQGFSPTSQIAHITPDGQLHHCQHGWHGRPWLSERVGADSRFRYASLSKLLTADMALRQQAAGQLALEGPVLELLPELPAPQDERMRQMKVADLLRHSAGFDRLRSIDPMVRHRVPPWCPYELAPLADSRLDFEPGTEYAYSNLNYCLLGVLLERSAGQDFRSLLEQEYGLNERGIRFVDGDYFPDEVSYDFRNSSFYGNDYSRHFDFFALSSSAGLSGSARALASLLATLHGPAGSPLTQAALPPDCALDEPRDCYGYAVFPYRAQELLVHVQPGFLYAAPSLAILDEHGGVTVWLGNGMRPSGSSTDPMLYWLYDALSEHYAHLDPRP